MAYLDNITSGGCSDSCDFAILETFFTSQVWDAAQWLNDPFSMYEFETALPKKKKILLLVLVWFLIKSLKKLSQNFKSILLNIYNQRANKCIPSSWKIQNVVLKPKPYKNANTLDGYRPISLTLCFAQCFKNYD